MLGYTGGLEYEVVAFQAVNAADLRGKTIHKAFGFDRRTSADQAASQEVAKRMAYWRWLIMDEVSLTDAKLLAKAEQRLRAVMPNANAWKTDPCGKVRPFAGVNVIFTGDFYQLPPPGGAYLADIPRDLLDPVAKNTKTHQDLLTEHGRQILWGGGTQGVTELTERERCKDPWWNEVVDELRAGQLSEQNWCYLHGIPVEGCALPAQEKASRQIVISSSEDPRLQEPKFKEAVAIVSNNDARYQINKDRAKHYSQAAKAPLRWAAAIDKASTEVLQSENCDRETKIRHLGINRNRVCSRHSSFRPHIYRRVSTSHDMFYSFVFCGISCPKVAAVSR